MRSHQVHLDSMGLIKAPRRHKQRQCFDVTMIMPASDFRDEVKQVVHTHVHTDAQAESFVRRRHAGLFNRKYGRSEDTYVRMTTEHVNHCPRLGGQRVAFG